MDTKSGKRKINLAGLTQKEKALLCTICISVLVIVGLLIYDFFLSPIYNVYWWEKGWSEAESRKILRNDMLSLFAKFIAFLVIVFSSHEMIGEWKTSKLKEGNKELANEIKLYLIGEIARLTGFIIAIFLLLLMFNANFQEHFIDGKQSVRLLKQALHDNSQFKELVDKAILESKAEAREDFHNGVMFVFWTAFCSAQLAEIITWLKFR